MPKQKEIAPRTPEAEKVHKEFLKRCELELRRKRVRDGIARGLAHNDIIEWEELTEANKQYYLSEADRIRNYLHSEDVVMKVDRELPIDCGLCTFLVDDRGLDVSIHNWICTNPDERLPAT